MPFRENDRTTTLEIIGRLSDSEILGKLNKQVVTPKFGTPLERSAALFRLLVDTPVRPPGDSRIWKWTDAELESELKLTVEAVEKWCVGKAAPKKAEHFLPVFVGEGGADESEQWRELRTRIEEIWRLAREYQRAEGRRKRAANRASRASVSVASPDEAPDTPNIVEPSLQSWGVERARIDVASRVGDLPETIYGRAEECDRLDRFLECNERGLTIVTGPAGSGKSALLAHWLRHRQGAGDLVVRHFISREYRGTTDPLEMLQHLLFQLAQRHIGIKLNEVLNRSSITAALDDLVRALKQPQSKRLILVIDGIDELVKRLPDHFVTEELAQNVFVVISCRASEGEKPSYLLPWLSIAKRGVAIESIELGGLDEADIELWCRENRDLNKAFHESNASDIAAKLRRLTDGLPLCLQHVLADKRIVAQDADSATLILEKLPSSFSEYIRQEFDRFVDDLGREWTRPMRLLFALLTRLYAPISTIELRAFLRHVSSWDNSFTEVPEFSHVDDKLRRWLSVQLADGHQTLSLTHPRFAQTFSEIMEIECADIDATFVPWLEMAWRSASEVGSRNVASYALDWLATHLTNGDVERKRRAVRILSSPTFLAKQMFDNRYALRRLQSSLDVWNDWGFQSELEPHEAEQWTAFWAENENKVFSAIGVALRHGYWIREIVLRCLGDRLVTGSDAQAPPPLALAPTSIKAGALMRSIDHPNPGGFPMIEVLSDRIATLGSYGGIHLWTLGGSRLNGRFDPYETDDPPDESEQYRGFRAVGSNFISWTNEGKIEFWNVDGQKIEGAGGQAYKSLVRFALCIGQSVVTWGGPSLRFWTLDGRLIASRDEDVHRSDIDGVLELPDRVVSWDEAGAIRFLTKTGKLLDGGGQAAHGSRISGIIRCGDRLLSWEDNGFARAWSLNGDPLYNFQCLPVVGPGVKMRWVRDRLFIWPYTGKLYSCDISGNNFEIVDDKERPRSGIRLIHDVLVDWGRHGIIFRSTDGKRLTGSHFWDTRVHDVMGNDKYIVSWSANTFQIWTREGRLVARGSEGIRGAQVLADRLLTWYHGLRFWRLDGQSYDPEPVIEEVLPLNDGFVTWGDDGSVLFWTAAGSRLQEGDKRAHESAVVCVVSFGDRIMSWSDMSGLRMWTLSGTALSGKEQILFDYSKGVVELREFGGGLVSRGGAGLRFWDKFGEERAETKCLPQQEVQGFVIANNKLITWHQNELQFWDEHRNRIQTVDRAHDDAVCDVVAHQDKLVSWERAGIIKIWSCFGQLEGWGHTGIAQLEGVAKGPNYLVLYGAKQLGVLKLRDGSLAVWIVDFEGSIAGYSICALDSSFACIGKSGLQIWTIGVDRMLALTNAQHARAKGVLAVRGCFVSWEYHGDLRFWTCDGNSCGSTIEKAHALGRIFSVVAFEDLIVSLGIDGVICVWRLNATLARVFAPPGKVRDIHVINDRLVATGQSLWVYSRHDLLAAE